MAKKKAEATEKKELTLAEKLKLIRQQNEIINEQAGKTVAGLLSDPEIADKMTLKFIPTPNLDLNAAIGGGFPIGRTTIITGLSDSGKTGLVLETIGKAMQKDDKFVALWLESEQSLTDIDYLVKQFGIDPARFILVVMDSNKGGEQAVEQAISYLRLGAVNLFCVNSLKALIPRTELNKPVSEDTVAMQARMNTKVLKQILPIIYDNDIALVLVQHLSTLIGTMSHDNLSMSGGLFLRYGNMLTLDMRKVSIGPGDPITKEQGMKSIITVRKNHVTPRLFPYVKVPHYVIYGEGTEVILSLLDRAVRQGILKSSGAWITWPEKDLRWNGKAKFREDMKNNPELLQTLINITDNDIEDLTDEELKELQIDPLADTKEEELKLMPVADIDDL